EALGEFHSTTLEGGLAIRAVTDGAGVHLQASHNDPQRTNLTARHNRAAAERLRNQIRRTLEREGRPAARGELKVGVYAHAYREQPRDKRMLRVADCEWGVMPSYRGVGEGGEEITDPRLVITLTDRAIPDRRFVMIHADDAEAAAIAERLDAALA